MASRLSLLQARRVALAAQGFGGPVAQQVTARQVRQVAQRVGQFQIDSVNVAVRAHYMPVFSRLGHYDRTLLDVAGGRAPRAVFEYWGHAASLLDVELYPALRYRMAERAREPWGAIRRIEAAHPGMVGRVLDVVAGSGPLTARQVEHPEERQRGSWWNWSEAKYALEWLFATGEVTAAGRNPQFERLYDLPERVLPAQWSRPALDVAEARLELVRRAAAALGVASLRCLADYFRMPLAATREAVAELVGTGELEPVLVEGWERETWLWHQARRPRRLTVVAVVSPFDSLVFERNRLLDLFGLHYRIEMYTPAAQRRFGYYVYLFVMDTDVTARVDLKADRGAGLLLVQASWLEAGAPEAETATRLAAALREMAAWLGLSGVVVAPVGTLHRLLAAELG